MERTRAYATLLGESVAIRLVRQQILTLGAVDATVLIEGETGTGKELTARALHDVSARRHAPFVPLSGVGLAELPLASQWFGHVRGSFAGAAADRVGLVEAAGGGTLFLDEIGDMPASIQPYLLRVLQEREVLRVGDRLPRPIDVRVLAATHRDLEHEVNARRFRQDLFYRLRVARIILPPLRQRPEDVPLLAIEFLQRACVMHRRQVDAISPEAMEQLAHHRWPGNVRELASTMEYAVIQAVGRSVQVDDLPPELSMRSVPPLHGDLSSADRRRILDALRQVRGNRSAAARLLGISRATLYRRLAAVEAVEGHRER